MAMLFHPDSRLISGGNDGIVRFWDVERAEQVMALPAYEDRIRCMTIDAEGDQLVTGSTSGALKIFDVRRPEDRNPLAPVAR